MSKLFTKLMGFAALIVFLVGFMFNPGQSMAQEPNKTHELTVYWEYYPNSKYYNPEDDGKEVSIVYWAIIEGTDKNGQKVSGKYVQQEYKGKVGEKAVQRINLDKMTDHQGDEYTDCTITSISVPVWGGNYIYGAGHTGSPRTGKSGIVINQNMNTQTEGSVAKDAIILDEDKENLNVRFSVSKNGKDDYTSSSNGKVIERIMKFNAGAMPVWNDQDSQSSFSRAILQNNLVVFYPKNGEIVKNTYILKAEFTGQNKDALNKRYTLTMTGNDLDGWKLELGSNIKKDVKKTNLETIDFKTVYEDDPTLEVGKEKIKTVGKAGQKYTETPYYYIVGKDGKEEVLKTGEGTPKVIEPVNQVVLRGTKAVKPVVTPTEKENIGGGDRTETAELVSKKYYASADHVVVARRDDFPDALTASVLAKALDAPILLTHTDHLDVKTASEIKRLGAKKAYIIGLDGAISKSTEKAIEAITGQVERIGGHDRYDTSAKIAKKVVEIAGNKKTAVIATGENFADALSVSPYAAKMAYPILLVKHNQVPEVIAKTVKELGTDSVYIAGGDQAVSTKLEKALPNLLSRISGSDRFETSRKLAEKFFERAHTAFLATGMDFADALVVGPVAAKEDAPILLTRADLLPEVIKSHIAMAGYKKIMVIGGEAAIHKTVWDSIK